MTTIMDMFSNLESLFLFLGLNDIQPSDKEKYPTMTKKHIFFIVINCIKLALGLLCLFLAQILRKKITQKKDHDMSAEIYLKHKTRTAVNDSSLKSAVVAVGFEN